MNVHERVPTLNAMFDSFKASNLDVRNAVVEGRKPLLDLKVYGRSESDLQYENEVVMAFGLDEFR